MLSSYRNAVHLALERADILMDPSLLSHAWSNMPTIVPVLPTFCHGCWTRETVWHHFCILLHFQRIVMAATRITGPAV